MEILKGLKVKNLGFIPQKMGDLLYHEGTLLAHFVDANNKQEHYFFKWSDCNDTYNRWLVFKNSTENLQRFFDKKISLLDLIKANPFVFIVDMADDLHTKSVMIVNLDKIPTTYLPFSDSFFEADEYEPYALTLQKQSVPHNDTYTLILSEIEKLKIQQKENHTLLQIVNTRVESFLHVNLKEDILSILEDVSYSPTENETYIFRNNISTGFSRFAMSSGSSRRVDSATNKDDLTIIEGIVPKIMQLCNEAGIWTFEELAATSVMRLQGILQTAGKHFQIHNPETWPAQSALAAQGKWAELKAWQEVLNARM